MIPSLLVTAGLSLVLFLSGFLSIATPLPFAFSLLRRGWKVSLPAVGLAAVFLWALYRWSHFLPFGSVSPWVGMAHFLAYALMGHLLVWVGRSAKSYEAGVAAILGILLALGALFLWVFCRQTHFNLLEALRGGIEQSVNQVIDFNEQAGLKGQELAFLKESAPRITARIFSLIPGMTLALLFFIITFNLSILRRWGGNRLFGQSPEFPLWRLPEFTIWIPIVAGTLFFLNLYLLKRPVVETALYNLFIGILILYLYQGLAIVSFFFRTRIPPFFRMAAYLLIFLFLQTVGVLIVALGLFDFWFDFRKLKKVS